MSKAKQSGQKEQLAEAAIAEPTTQIRVIIFHVHAKRQDCRGWKLFKICQNGQPPEKGSSITSQAARAKQPKKSRGQVETVGAKRPQSAERRSARKGEHDEDSPVWYIKAEHTRIETSQVGPNNSKPVSTGRVLQAQTLYKAPIPGVVCESCEKRESRSASGDTKDKTSTAKAAGTKCLKVLENKPGLRRVRRDATSDEKVAELQSIVKTRLPERPLRDTEGFLVRFV